MHELAFAEQVLEEVQREAHKYPGSKVVRVKLRAGELLALEPSSLRFCLEAVSAGTVMECARIDICESGPEISCPSCGIAPASASLGATCPRCGQEGRLELPTHLIIEEIELDDEDGPT